MSADLSSLITSSRLSGATTNVACADRVMTSSMLITCRTVFTEIYWAYFFARFTHVRSISHLFTILPDQLTKLCLDDILGYFNDNGWCLSKSYEGNGCIASVFMSPMDVHLRHFSMFVVIVWIQGELKIMDTVKQCVFMANGSFEMSYLNTIIKIHAQTVLTYIWYSKS